MVLAPWIEKRNKIALWKMLCRISRTFSRSKRIESKLSIGSFWPTIVWSLPKILREVLLAFCQRSSTGECEVSSERSAHLHISIDPR